MAELVETKLQLMAVALATELDYANAARRLNISRTDLERQIAALENLLCMKMFRLSGKEVVVTDEGRIFVEKFQAFQDERDTKNT